jgi:hypothetical protein
VAPRVKGKRRTTLQTQASAWRTEGLSEEASGRRERRSLSQQIRSILSDSHFPERRRRAEDECERHIRKFQLAQFKFEFGLFLGLFALGDFFAKLARMLAVKSFCERNSNGTAFRIRYYHPCPRDGLQKRPMQANRGGQGQGHENFGKPRKHIGTLSNATSLSSCPACRLVSLHMHIFARRAHGSVPRAIDGRLPRTHLVPARIVHVAFH